MIKSVHDSILWIKVDGKLFPNKQDVYVAFVNIPPDGNTYYQYYDVDLFLLLEEDVLFYRDNGCVLVIGDLNSRSGTQTEYIINDSLNDGVRQHISHLLEYEDSTVRVPRNSEDKTVNNFGRRLLNLCRATNLVILNGRTISDSAGSLTFQNHLGASVIDYAVADNRAFDVVTDFNVGALNEFSDHAPIYITLRAQDLNGNNTFSDCYNGCIEPSYYTKVRWNDELKPHIQELMNSHHDSLHAIFDDVMTTGDTNHCVTRFTDIMTSIFESCTEKHKVKCQCTCHRKRATKSLTDKPWFDDTCKRLRHVYLDALRVYNSNRSDQNRVLLSARKREYKLYMNKAKIIFRQYEGDQLEYLRRTNPKAFFRHFKKTNPPTKNRISMNTSKRLYLH